MRRLPPSLLLAAAVFLAGCRAAPPAAVPAAARLVDPQATPETRALYARLAQLAPDHVLFGHQDDLAYGVGWTREPGRSDVKETAGAYPAVYGWDAGDLEHGADRNLDGVRFDDMRRWITEAYRRGGVSTLSWHMDNPASGGDAWDTTRAAFSVLPGGARHAQYRAWLDRFADFARSLESDGRAAPLLFRPFHEHTGGWFWWGKGHVTPEEYRALWRFTAAYLRDERDVHNLIYVYSTDVFSTPEEYLAHYPGDEWVDVLGYDDYQALASEAGVPDMTRRLRLLVGMAEARGKPAALTETGQEGVPSPTWWTGRLLRALTADPMARRIAWALVWRNAHAADKPGHFYAPHPGHPSVPDFVRFRQDPFVLFEDELPPMYTLRPGR